MLQRSSLSADSYFPDTEKLWRAINSSHLKPNGNLENTALRFQVSIGRENYSTPNEVLTPNNTGIAEIRVNDVYNVANMFTKTYPHLWVGVIDEQLPDKPGHAIIAITELPGYSISNKTREEAFRCVRKALAGAFTVIKKPTK
jgi:hypothetical protein